MTTTKSYYTILAILAAAYIVAVYYFQTTPQYLLFVTGIFAASHVVWGVVHHLHSHNFHPRIVLEYLLVAILGVAIVSTLLL